MAALECAFLLICFSDKIALPAAHRGEMLCGQPWQRGTKLEQPLGNSYWISWIFLLIPSFRLIHLPLFPVLSSSPLVVPWDYYYYFFFLCCKKIKQEATRICSKWLLLHQDWVQQTKNSHVIKKKKKSQSPPSEIQPLVPHGLFLDRANYMSMVWGHTSNKTRRV